MPSMRSDEVERRAIADAVSAWVDACIEQLGTRVLQVLAICTCLK